jgi:TonB-linked SusC/RagA family outer membrane protein
MKNILDLRVQSSPGLKKYIMELKIAVFIIIISISSVSTIPAYSQLKKADPQQTVVTGKVIDKLTGEAMTGVNILVKGSTTGAITDQSGKYSIPVSDRNAVLVISFIGYISTEIPSEGKSVVDVYLVSDVQNLDEVVVVGYSSKQRSQLTSSVASVSSERLLAFTSSNINTMLQGQVAGVVVSSSSGSPNANANVVIRGSSSISAGSYPLYVVDGIIGGNPDPSDIETVTILKDAAATGLYGSRAANGVIIITTKSGKSGKTKINFNSTFGVSKALQGKSRPMNSQELYDFQKSFYTPEKFAIDRPDSLLNTNTNWWDVFYRNALIKSYDLSASGGNEKTQVYASGSYYSEDGTLLHTGRKTYNLRSNIVHKINEKIKLNMRFNGRFINTENEASGDYGALSGAAANIPWDNPYNANGTLKRGNEPGWIGREYRSYIYDLQYNFDYTKGFGIDVDAGLDYIILPNLVFTSTNRVSYNSSKRELYYDARSQTSQSAGVGFLQNWTNNNNNLITSNRLKYDKSFGFHVISVMAVLEGEKNFSDANSISGSKLPVGLHVMDVVAQINGVTGNTSQNAFNKGLVQVDYSFNSKYFLVGSFINESSSRFGANNRSANFYTLGASWIMSNENFMKKITSINQLKFRASYGLIGNANIGDYQALGLYSYADQYNNNSATYPYQLGNPNLTWEKTGTYNIGLDINVFNRITLNVDAYSKTSNALLLNVDKAYTSGYSTIIANVGSVRNRGLEINLTTVNIIRSSFRWETNFNIAFNKNVVLKLADHKDITIPYQGTSANIRIHEGLDMNSYYMRKFSRVNPDNGEPLWELDVVDADGNITVTETNNYTLATQKYVGTASPKFTGGISNTLSYKSFSLTAFANFTYGNMRDGYGYANGDAQTTNVRILAPGESIWKNPGDIATYPKAIFGGNLQSTKISSLSMGSGSYIRLRNVTVGYQLPESLLQRVNVSKAKVYVSGDNLWTGTRFPGRNPESVIARTGASTGDYNYGEYPFSMKILFGINLEF